MSKVGIILKWIVSNIFYPVVVIGSIIYLGVKVVTFIVDGFNENNEEGVRRLTAGLLPVIGLIFVVTMIESNDKSIQNFFESLNSIWGIIIGFIIGFLLIAIGKKMGDWDEGIMPALFILFLSFMFSFILYSLMSGYSISLNYILFSIIIGGGTNIILFGIPR